MRARLWFVLLLGAVFTPPGKAQLPSLPLFEQKIATAFNPLGRTPASVTLSGSASWVAGSQKDSGTLQLEISADGTTSEAWSFAKVSHSFTQGPLTSRSCVYTDAAGKQHPVNGPNCVQAVPWFFPFFVLEAPYIGATVTDATGARDSSQGLEKLAYVPALPDIPGVTQPVLDTLTRLQKATGVTIYYDAQTALPSKLVYQQAADRDEAQGIEVSVLFSNYSAESGFMIPHRIQRYIQRTLQLDFTVTGVTVQ